MNLFNALSRVIALTALCITLVAIAPLSSRAALLDTQVDAILSLLSSFGAEPAVISNVEQALRPTSKTACPSFSEVLGRGMSGSLVIELQTFLSVTPASGYFGPITEVAVQKFQREAGIVLSGTAESTGYGVIGPKTARAISDSCTSMGITSKTSSNSHSPVTSTTTVSTSTPPSLTGIELFRAKLHALAEKQKVAASDLTVIDAAIDEQVNSGIDYKNKFLNAWRGQKSTSQEKNNFFTFVKETLDRLAGALVPTAYAVTGTPFGGALEFAFYCACSDTWLLTIQPLPPSYAALLSYLPETQEYSGYNIPFTAELLGFYIPGAGVCLVPGYPTCIYTPNEGYITPFVGSSSL